MKVSIRGSWHYKSINVLLAFLLAFGLSPQAAHPAQARAEMAEATEVPTASAAQAPARQELMYQEKQTANGKQQTAPAWQELLEGLHQQYQPIATVSLTMASSRGGTTIPAPGSSSRTLGAIVPIQAVASQGICLCQLGLDGRRQPRCQRRLRLHHGNPGCQQEA